MRSRRRRARNALQFFAMLRRSATAADLRGRRRDPANARRRAARVRARVRHAGRDDADGSRRVRHDPSVVDAACSACTARRSRTTPSTIATSCSRSARASTIASPAMPPKFAPQREAHRADRHRRVRDQQGQARCSWITSAMLPRGAARAARVRPAQRLQARLVARGTRTARSCKRDARDELRPRQRR